MLVIFFLFFFWWRYCNFPCSHRRADALLVLHEWFNSFLFCSKPHHGQKYQNRNRKRIWAQVYLESFSVSHILSLVFLYLTFLSLILFLSFSPTRLPSKCGLFCTMSCTEVFHSTLFFHKNHGLTGLTSYAIGYGKLHIIVKLCTWLILSGTLRTQASFIFRI